MKNNSLTRTVDDVMVFLKLIMILVFIAYWLSGIRVIKPGQIGLVTRFGSLKGSTPAEQIHKPGWVFALPRPIEEVLIVPVKQVREFKITELSRYSVISSSMSENASSKDKNTALLAANTFDMSETIDPVQEGYCISGDQNIFQTTIIVKYQISDPVAACFSFIQRDTFDNLLNSVIVAEMTHTSGEISIDGILSRQKQELAYKVKTRSQKRLDDLNTGIILLSIEFQELSPPMQVNRAFEEVNTAAINRKKEINDAKSFKEEVIPQSMARARSTVNNAHVYTEEIMASSQGNSEAYVKLLSAFKINPIQIKADMINKSRMKIFSKVKDIIVLPTFLDAPVGFSTIIQGSAPAEDVYYYDNNND